MENEQIDILNTNDKNTNKQFRDELQKISKPYKKYINFYNIELEPSFNLNNKSLSTILYDAFEKAFLNIKKVSVDGAKIECLNKSDKFIFGCIHKESEPDILTEIKTSTNNINIDIEDLIFEYLTFFYIDYKTSCISVIKTQRIQNSCNYIENLLHSFSDCNFSIIPFKKDKREIEQINATGINLTYVDVDNFQLLKELNSDECELSKFQFKATFKKTSKNFVANLIKNYTNNKKVKKLSISTDSEDIDILKSTFTKQVAITLNKDFKEDLNSIMYSLRDELLKIVNT